MEKETIFADGMNFERPRPNAPTFVKGRIDVNVEKFKIFMETYKNQRGYVSIDLKESKKGTLYLSLNDFEPKKKEPVDEEKTYRSSLESTVAYPESKGTPDFSVDDLPAF